MSNPDEIASQLQQCAVATCWNQWSALAGEGVPVGQHPVRSIIDPEALVLMSLALRDVERRFDDRLQWWARLGSSLMSVQRMRTLLNAFPETLAPEVSWFAGQVVAAGDGRWRVLAGEHPAASSSRRWKGAPELQFLLPSTLMIRLRAGFGVGAKADLLAFLIGLAPVVHDRAVGASVAVIAKAICYSIVSVRRAAGDMALARLLVASTDRPTEYSLAVEPWAGLLQLRDPYRPAATVHESDPPEHHIPPWRFWAQMFGFVTAFREWHSRWGSSEIAPVVRASHARDVAERYHGVLVRNGIPWTDPKTRPGEGYLAVFHRLVFDVTDWMSREA